MGLARPDAMIEHCLSVGMATPEGWRKVPLSLVGTWPEARIPDLLLALCEAGHAVETNFDPEGPSAALALHFYRMAALIALDDHAVQASGVSNPCGRDLLAHWRASDPYFLELADTFS